MKRREAINIVQGARQYLTAGNPIWDAEKVDEAMKMAIEALSAPSGDLISRADALMELNGVCSNWQDDAKVAEIIHALPSAEAEWIPCSERLPEVGEICLLTVREYGWNCKDYTRVIIGEYSDNYADHILAWMPLPKPYKAESEEV